MRFVALNSVQARDEGGGFGRAFAGRRLKLYAKLKYATAAAFISTTVNKNSSFNYYL